MVGETVAEYRIEEVVGRGGMGTVYRATDTALDKAVALKMLAPRLAEDETFLKRFRSEARALARLDHPGIVRVHALRESVKGIFIVMEHIEGESLDAVLRRRGALPPSEAVRLFAPVLRAIGHAHASGVLHRDLKPSNLLVTDSGAIKITDFGLAKIHTAEAGLTATHETAGTTGYMSPEQIQGLRHVDERSDLFSIGMMLYETLAGRLPFDKKKSAFTIQRHIVEETFLPPSAFGTDVADPLSEVVMTALAKDPDDRYESAGAMLEALEPFVEEDRRVAAASPSASSSRAGAPKHAFEGKETRWQPVFTVSAFMLVGLLALGGSLYAVHSFLPDPSASATPAQKKEQPVLATGQQDDSAETPAATDSFATSGTEGRRARSDSTSEKPPSLNEKASPEDTKPEGTQPEGTQPEGTQPGKANSSSAATNSPPTTQTASQNGTLRLTSRPPGATVYLDGERQGTTPLTVSGLSPGSYDVTMRRTGYASYTGTARVTAGETHLERGRLRARQPAVLRVRAAPWGTIQIDGRTIASQSNLFHTDTLEAGTHTIVATHPQLGRRDSTIQLSPGSVRKVILDLR